ncbi:glycoside hydrolase family 2 TIM barrel-domain containing protein [uncultured Polaribacter sp.]|uniref:glycoside hydrolase family 2 TIM barrel-domain containing protein n=1 Tax=uncultured Polaribacter sp. TaxID=174711 RepID=UPI002618050F|nr:glycoside hydrolase family 2 TIM barrel-domain containing protein [uncultured Polaribacter sp.]
MKNHFLRLLLFLVSFNFFAQKKVEIINNEEGMKLVVNGKDFMINGMNWDYVPIGTNYSYSLWKQPEDLIKAALDAEMGLLKNMGVNAIRVYTGIQPKWIAYIYETYGIYTMLNHSFGRYGLTINNAWVPVTDYRDPKTKEMLLSEVTEMAKIYKGTPGLLLFLLGNENNYGLFWAGAETEDFPDDEEMKRAMGEKRGRPMYKLFNEAAKQMKAINPLNPIAICNGDLLFADMVADECPDIDIYGTNMYRGKSFGDAFERVKKELNKPILFTEFGADAFNSLTNQEDQKMQVFFMVENWKEIYENSAGLGKVGNSIGGFTFMFSDGWWKLGQTENLDVHDTEASWSNGGYFLDTKDGSNNMNEEWFGICAKGPTNEAGLYTLYPRAAYYSLKEVHSINPFGEDVTANSMANHFSKISLMDGVLRARGDKAALGGNEKIKLSNLRAEFTTFNTGGSLLTTPQFSDGTGQTIPDRLGFDHMQSYFIGVQGQPTSNMRAEINFNILGNVAGNPIDDIFYENVGRPIQVDAPNGIVTLTDNNRVRVYNAEFEWKAKDFDMRGFYRTGHYHWAYEGDIFGLYPEANYGPNLDIYNGEILGIEVDGKGALAGLKAAFGPQLWWGANPAVLLKYRRKLGGLNFTAIYHKDIVAGNGIDENGNRILDPTQTRSGFIPALPTERTTIALEKKGKNFGFQLGAIWAGRPINGRTFQVTTGDVGNYTVYNDRINAKDNWGGKAKVTYSNGGFNWYAQGSVMGLVANGGVDPTLTFTGWKLKDSGSGNMSNFLSGIAYNFGGKFQIAPNFLYQKPLVDAMPNNIGSAPGRLRNFVDDPFAVRGGNRETTAGEILFTFDPTPGTYMYDWDNDRTEDAKFAFNLGFVYRHLPTTQDAAIGFFADRSFFAFDQSAPAKDLWEVNSRIVSKVNPDLGLIANVYFGNAQPNGSDARTIERFGGDIRMVSKKFKLVHTWKINDWGPFDYHRDFNLTYPVQLMLDVSTSVGKPDWFILPDTKIGLRGTWRSLNEFSPRYSPNATSSAFATSPTISPVGFPDGSEWEIRTYIHINIGK